jgi:2,5-dihydroxypyridine 5,6-dioxygenase
MFAENTFDVQVAKTANKLLKDLLKTRKEDVVVITFDTESDWRFAVEVERAAYELGAKPLLVRNRAPPHVGRAAEPYLPVEGLREMVSTSDVWVELNAKWLLYSSIYEEAIRRKRTRYMCLVGMSTDMAVRCVGNVNIQKVLEFQQELQRITKKAKQMRYTTPAGTNITFENDPNRPVLVEGDVSGPGEYMLLGQVDWAPREETVNGTIVFDGSVNPPDQLGLLKNPVKLEVKNGVVIRAFGSEEASVYWSWLLSLKDQNMYKIAHISYGCNPGAKLTGNVLEDERIWGCLEWGIGNQSDTFAAKGTRAMSHSDGITLRPTLIADDELLIDDGKYVHPRLVELERLACKPIQ